MRYVLRADASQSIGAGHVMRSSAIAEELIARGEDVVFIGRISDLPWVEERISELGFAHIYNKPSGFISNPDSDVLIIDSYEINKDDTFITPEKWLHIVAMVDELTPNYHCTLRIHPGMDSAWDGDSKTPILSGPRYIPFRGSLSQNIATRNLNRKKIKITVVAGGSDPYALVSEIAKILVRFTELFEVYLFSNSTFNFPLDERFQYIKIGSNLDALTQDMDLILTTSSTSSLEFIARGLCVGVACAVNNQEQNYNSLEQIGAAAQIGSRNRLNKWEIDAEKIRQLVTSKQLRKSLVSQASGILDFKGASRIADALKAL